MQLVGVEVAEVLLKNPDKIPQCEPLAHSPRRKLNGESSIPVYLVAEIPKGFKYSRKQGKRP